MTTPPPRPALRRAPDADVSPALTRAVSNARPAGPSEHGGDREGTTAQSRPGTKPGKTKSGKKSGNKAGKKSGKKSGKTKSGKEARKKSGAADEVLVSFPLSPAVVVSLDERADLLGHSRERTLTLLVQAWLDL